MLTNNKLSSNTSTFSLKNTFFPAENSNIKVYSKKRIGNLTYFTPNDDTYFWYGGNGNLPSVNTKQLDYFENHFQIIPQLRTTNLKDGFCSKKVKQK